MVAEAKQEDRIHCYHMGLSNYDGSTGLIRDKSHSSLAKLGGNGAEESVTVAQLDSMDLTPPHVIKIDVEGHEAAVLAGASRMLRDHRPAVNFETLRHVDEPALSLEPFRILQEAGHTFFQPAWGKLALRPVSGEDRFLMDHDFNVLGWPCERMDELRELFPGY